MIREILQLHFEKIIHVYTVLQKWKKGQLRNFKCSSWTEDKILKKHKKNTKKKKIEKSKLVTSKAILLKIRYFFFFLNCLSRNIQKWNDHLKILQISSRHFSFQIGKKQCLHTISRILDTVLRRFERKAFVREMQSRSEPCATSGVVWIVHFICLPFSKAPRANSAPFGSDRSIVRNPTTGVADTLI